MEAVHDALQILATDEEGTRCALAEAKRLARASHPRVVLLVPHVLSCFSPPADPRETTAITDRYRAMATAAGVDAVVRLCVCRRIDDVFRWMLARHSRIVVGGRRRWWWPTVDQRLARRLQQWGHDVVFAHINAPD